MSQRNCSFGLDWTALRHLCSWSVFFNANALKQASHVKGLRFSWTVSICLFKLLSQLNVFPHWSQLKSFSCSWTHFKWRTRWAWIPKTLLQMSQGNDFLARGLRGAIFKCTALMCLLSPVFCPKCFPQSSQVATLVSQWTQSTCLWRSNCQFQNAI